MNNLCSCYLSRRDLEADPACTLCRGTGVFSDTRELDLALAFANVEVLELQAGRRALTGCPGLKVLCKFIAEAERGKR